MPNHQNDKIYVHRFQMNKIEKERERNEDKTKPKKYAKYKMNLTVLVDAQSNQRVNNMKILTQR